MSHKAVRDLLSDTAYLISDGINFDYSAITDFNSIKNKKAPFIHVDLFTITPQQIHNSFNYSFETTILFYALDDPGGVAEDTNAILDQTELMMSQFIRLLNKAALTPDDGTVSIISSDSIELSFSPATPMRKVLADCLTGWMLPVKILCPDDFDYCSLYPTS